MVKKASEVDTSVEAGSPSFELRKGRGKLKRSLVSEDEMTSPESRKPKKGSKLKRAVVSDDEESSSATSPVSKPARKKRRVLSGKSSFIHSLFVETLCFSLHPSFFARCLEKENKEEASR